MIDHLIHKTLDNRELLTDQVSIAVEKSLDAISLDAVIENPREYLVGYAQQVALKIMSEHLINFMDEGKRFAEEVKTSRKPVTIPESTNPNLNKGELDD